MNPLQHIELLQKISHLEGLVRMAENYGDLAPLEYLIRDPEMEDLIKRHFCCSSGAELLNELRSGTLHTVLDGKFAGARLLFHTRKCREQHTLPNTHLLYCIRGKCVVCVGRKEMELQEGDTCIIAADAPHSYFNCSEDTLVLHVALTAAFIGNVLIPRLPQEHFQVSFFRKIVLEDPNPTSYIFVGARKSKETTYFITSAVYNQVYRPSMYEELVNSFMLLFFAYLLQGLDDNAKYTDTAEPSPEQILQEMKDFICTNCRTVSLRQLAEKFHFNESYLSQYLKKNTGKNFTAFLKSARIAAAERMLINTNQSVVDIAAKVGYQNMSYFYKLFNEVNQCSPAEFRARFLKSSQRVIGQEKV